MDEYLIRATEGLKNSTLGVFFGEMGVFIKNLIMQFGLNFFTTHLIGDFERLGGIIKKTICWRSVRTYTDGHG